MSCCLLQIMLESAEVSGYQKENKTLCSAQLWVGINCTFCRHTETKEWLFLIVFEQTGVFKKQYSPLPRAWPRWSKSNQKCHKIYKSVRNWHLNTKSVLKSPKVFEIEIEILKVSKWGHKWPKKTDCIQTFTNVFFCFSYQLWPGQHFQQYWSWYWCGPELQCKNWEHCNLCVVKVVLWNVKWFFKPQEKTTGG